MRKNLVVMIVVALFIIGLFAFPYCYDKSQQKGNELFKQDAVKQELPNNSKK